MSVNSELTDLATYLSNAYTTIGNKGGTIPQNKNMYNLADAINSITQNQPIIIPPSAGTLQSIAVTTSPTKTTYLEGEYFDYRGCVITAIYQNATYDVTNDCTFVCNTPLQYGDTLVTVYYSGQSTSIAITVTAVPVPAPLSTKLLLHCNGNLVNEVTNDTTGISGTYTACEGKFSQGHFPSGSSTWLSLQGFQASADFTNYGMGWWTKTGASNSGNLEFMVKRSNSWYNLMNIDGNGYLVPNQSIFTISNVINHATFSQLASHNSWVYYAIQIKPNSIECYINGSLSSEATLNGIYASFNDIQNRNTANSNYIDEVIIAEDNVYRKNNAEWTLS